MENFESQKENWGNYNQLNSLPNKNSDNLTEDNSGIENKKTGLDADAQKYFENHNDIVEYYDVYTTNGVDGYIKGETLKKVCAKMSSEQLSKLVTIVDLRNFDEENQYLATDELIKFIADNTNKPKYKPRFVLVKWRERTINRGDNDPEEKEKEIIPMPRPQKQVENNFEPNEIYGGIIYDEVEEEKEMGMSL